MPAHQICTFVLDELLFGVDVAHIQEVLRFQEMTAIPLSPTEIRGLINLRGQIVVALDMRARLGFGSRDGDPPMNVVVRRSDGVVSLLVDKIGDVLELDDRALERPPETMVGTLREMVKGIYKLDRQLLIMLDLHRVLDAERIARSP
jgi:purine-binding chemotaxis protein CheW